MVNRANLPVVDGVWQVSDLVKLRLTVENQSLKYQRLKNVPITMMTDVFLGGPKRDQHAEYFCDIRFVSRLSTSDDAVGVLHSRLWVVLGPIPRVPEQFSLCVP